MTYGERFRQLRQRATLTQQDVAERLYGTRDRQGNVASIEAIARRVPSPESVAKHAAALGCRISDLVTEVDDTWIDRARRGEYDDGRPRAPLERPAAAGRRAGSR